MKIFPILILTIFICFSAFSQERMTYSKVKIDIEKSQVYELAKIGLPIDDGVKYEKNYLLAEYSQAQLNSLTENGFQYEVLIEDLSKFYADRNNSITETNRSEKTPENFNLGTMGGNLTYDELLTELDDMQTLYPDLITTKTAITNEYTTHEGNEIYWVKISDNPNTSEDEYEVLFTGLHHAREPVSMMQLVYLMWYLLENYEDGGEVQYLVDNFEIYFVPCVNPDGYEYNQATDPNGGGMWRRNLRDNNNDGVFNPYDDGVDLNRNYPYQWGYNDEGSSPDPTDDTYRGPSAGSEPETQMMIEFTNQHEFILANNHHTYSNLLLFPWGYEEIESDDEPIFDQYAEIMTAQNGYTCGHGWEILYTVNGDTNDWMYGEHGILSFTAETGDEFWPPSNEIIPLCEENLEMNLYLIRLAGSYAEISDKEPSIVPAFGMLNFDIHFLGMNLDGDFTVEIQSEAFEQTGEAVTFEAGTYQQLEHKQDSVFYLLKPEYQIGDEFTYTLSVSDGNSTYSKEITKTLGKLNTILNDPANDLQNWTSTTWTTTNESSHSPSFSITDSEGGNYQSNSNTYITLNEPVNVVENSLLNFYAKWSIENDWDYAQLLISADGGATWQPLATEGTNPGTGDFQPTGEPVYDGSSSWQQQTYNLQSFVGEQVVFRFLLMSDGFVEADGFYFDDFSIMQMQTENIAPIITANSPLTTVGNFTEITLNQLTVTDPDSNYPDDFLLIIEEGTDYTVSENGIETETGFSGTLQINVRVHDGFDQSEVYTISHNLLANVAKNNTKIEIYPNPATGIVNLSGFENLTGLKVTDISGKTISNVPYSTENNQCSIDLSGLENGIYLLKIETEKGVFTGKIIKQ